MKRNKGMIVLGFLLALILIVAGFLAVTYYNHNRAPEVPETTVPSTDAVTTSATAYTGELELPVAGGVPAMLLLRLGCMPSHRTRRNSGRNCPPGKPL